MHINRTQMYLSPVLNSYNSTFITEFLKFKVEGYYLIDIDYYQAKKLTETIKVMFIHLIKPNLKEIRKSAKYYDDYPYDMEGGHILVLKVPEKSFDAFIRGGYSEMYTREELKGIKVNPVYKGVVDNRYLIFTKDPEAFSFYKEAIRLVYGVTNVDQHPPEYDIPPRMHQEVLGWNKNKELVKQLGITNN